MTKDLIRHNRPVWNHLHPLIYKAMIGLALWFVLSAWLLFSSGGYMEFLLVVVSGFILIAVATPCVLWLNWRKFQGSGAGGKDGESLRDWMSGEFETWQYRVSGREAAIEILLPLAAVAFGFAAFGIVLHFAVTS